MIGAMIGALLFGWMTGRFGRRFVFYITLVIYLAGVLLAGVLLIATALGFGSDAFSAWTQTLAWMLIFFFASAAASSAYLTASEIFPLETGAANCCGCDKKISAKT